MFPHSLQVQILDYLSIDLIIHIGEFCVSTHRKRLNEDYDRI